MHPPMKSALSDMNIVTSHVFMLMATSVKGEFPNALARKVHFNYSVNFTTTRDFGATNSTLFVWCRTESTGSKKHVSKQLGPQRYAPACVF
jgi:hypothetical protein